MSRTVIVNLDFVNQDYPGGTTTTGTQVTLVVPAGAAAIPPQTIAPGVTTASFSDVPAGMGYTATAQLLDGTGLPLGAVATSAPFDVTNPTVSIPTPAAITVTVSA